MGRIEEQRHGEEQQKQEGGGTVQQERTEQSQQKAGQPLPTAPEDKPAEELTEEELRLMADTMPGDGPGDD